MNSICLDGKFLPADEPALRVDNKGFRYGDGLFETIKVYKGRIMLEDYHFERLLASLGVLKMQAPATFTRNRIAGLILQLCEKNKCTDLARVRLTIFRGHGGIYDGDGPAQFCIECRAANPAVNTLNENGLVIALYTGARKSGDSVSHIKSSNYLPYVLAAQFAKERQCNDAIVLNQHHRPVESSIANLFIIKNGAVLTPPLSEGCIDGVMRRHLLAAMAIQEKPLTRDDLLNADELFLSNAMNGIRWVKQFEEKSFGGKRSRTIYASHIKTFFD